MMRRGLLSITCLLLASCSLAPDYHRPETPAAVAYKETAPIQDGNGNLWSVAKPGAADAPRGQWWQVFHDQILNDLETKLINANQNLKAAVARYDEARAAAGIARADYFPTITGAANTGRTQTSKTITDSRPISLYNDTSVGADASYELDLWGRVRNNVRSAENRAAASAADLAAVNLSLQAELAMDYFTLRGDDTSQQILDQTVTAYQKALELTQNLHNGGAATEADVDQAETQLQNAKTMAEDMRLKRAQLEHAVAVLTGAMPASFTLPAAVMDDQQSQEKMITIDPGVPSVLLERRPDIAEAERLVAAANADIGVARAAYFPDFTLTGSAGYESATLGNLVKSSSLFWALGPSVTTPLFDGGRIASMSDQAHAAYDETVANYRQTVLSAYQEVEDNLAAIRQLDKEHESQTAATAAAERALKQSQNRYTGGIVTYLDVVVAQNTALQAELASVDIRTRQLNAHVALIKALGGGWAPEKL
jgi:NodT family efflux transporter outer membrane factor (OMF) lipoprotein